MVPSASDPSRRGIRPRTSRHRPMSRSEYDTLDSDRPHAAAGNIRLGLSSGALYPTPTDEVPALAARHGFRDLEIMLQTPGEYDPGFARMIDQRCRDAGCRVHSVHLWHDAHRLLTPYARRTREGLALFDRGIEWAALLGAPILVWHGANKQDIATPDGWQRFLDAVAERGAACAAANRMLTLENVSWCALATVREVSAFSAALETMDPDRVIGYTFDPFQAAEAGANPFMLLAAMGNRVANVHLSDLRQATPGARHLLPGEGDLPWSALLRAVHAIYQGPLMIEGVVASDLHRLDQSRAFIEPMLESITNQREDACCDALPPGVREGIRLFNAGQFYACHEVIEHEWHAERRPIRRLYQGILQIGVGFHHALAGNQRGARLLLQDGIEKVSDFLPVCLGIETDLLVSQARSCLDRLIELGPDRVQAWDASSIPRIMPFGTEDTPR